MVLLKNITDVSATGIIKRGLKHRDTEAQSHGDSIIIYSGFISSMCPGVFVPLSFKTINILL
jgi:hypothetical protein